MEEGTIKDARKILDAVNSVLVNEFKKQPLTADYLKGVIFIVVREDQSAGGLVLGYMKPQELLIAILTLLTDAKIISDRLGEAILATWTVENYRKMFGG